MAVNNLNSLRRLSSLQPLEFLWLQRNGIYFRHQKINAKRGGKERFSRMFFGDVACRVFGNLANLVGEIRVAQRQLEVVQTLRHVFRGDVVSQHDADVGQHKG